MVYMLKNLAGNRFWQATVLICLMALILSGSSFLMAELLIERDLANAKVEIDARASSMVHGMEENIRRVFSQGDIVLLFMKSEWESDGAFSSVGLDTLKSFLTMGIIDHIAVADTKGNLVFTAAPIRETINIFDREHFQAQIASDRGLYIAEPVVNRVTGAYSIFMSRRLNDAQGNFAGIVSVGLDRNYLNKVFHDMGLGDANTTVLLRSDGTFMARVPEADEQIAGSFKSHPIWEFVNNGVRAGSYQSVGKGDGITRMGAFGALTDYPLVVLVSFQKEAVFKAAIARSAVYWYWAAAFSTLVILAFATAWWQLRRQYKIEITLRNKERDLKYISYHDQLTGIFNRAYFYERMKNLSSVQVKWAAVMVLDVDGLKMVNDTFGHEAGDRLLCEAANVLVDCVPSEAIVARIGGDEFAILLTNADQGMVETVTASVQKALKDCNFDVHGKNMPVQLSIGFALANGKQAVPEELLAAADKWMYREKLLQASSRRSQIVTTLTEMLAARDYITEGHASRIQEMVVALARDAGLESYKIPDLELFAHFHDIGKVGISDNILNKQGPLTDYEWREMKTHSELGHRIAKTTVDLLPIADWILKHHERWDGNGYPFGLVGTKIPIECRILAIADAYDAITNDRPYRKAASQEEALAEIRKNAGLQFDPELVDRFEKLVRMQS